VRGPTERRGEGGRGEADGQEGGEGGAHFERGVGGDVGCWRSEMIGVCV